MLELEVNKDDDIFSKYDKIKRGLKHAKKVMQKNLDYLDNARSFIDLKLNPL